LGADEGSPVESWPLTGRDEELDFVLSALHAPSSGGVLLAGPAGVGKSRLAREALAAADATGSATVAVTATQAMASIPFGAVAGVIGDDAPRGRTRLELFQVVCRRLVEQAGTRPLVVGVDDGHRLDDGSAALVMHLVVAGAARVVMTVRSRLRMPSPRSGRKATSSGWTWSRWHRSRWWPWPRPTWEAGSTIEPAGG
jgi:hypothetical protein